MKWAQSLVECVAMSNPCQHEIDAVVKLISQQPITDYDAAWLLHMVATNPMMKLDSLDIEEFEQWLSNYYGKEIYYEHSNRTMEQRLLPIT